MSSGDTKPLKDCKCVGKCVRVEDFHFVEASGSCKIRHFSLEYFTQYKQHIVNNLRVLSENINGISGLDGLPNHS